MVTIPIVLASDENYAPQMLITMLSAVLNKSKNTIYDFYCLVPNKFPQKIKKHFDKLAIKYKNVNVNFVIMKNAFNDASIVINHITTPTYYRLAIPEILKKYDKAIYLDVDIAVNGDLKELYEINIDKYYVAGVKAAAWMVEEQKLLTNYYSETQMTDLKEYINAGVTLWNLEKIRKDNKTKELYDLAQKNFKVQDQDVINVAFYKNIKILDLKYNFMTKYYNNPHFSDEVLEEIYGKKELNEAKKNPVIIHYADRIKPWSRGGCLLDKCWKKYAVKSALKCNPPKPLAEEIFVKSIDKKRKTVFWGASVFLEDMLAQNKIHYQNILGVIDKNPSRKGQYINKYQIFEPKDLSKLKPDCVIFSIFNRNQEIYPQVKEFMEKNYPNIEFLPNLFE